MNTYKNNSIFICILVSISLIIFIPVQVLFFVNFSKMVTDTRLKFSAYTNILTSFPMMYHTLM